jgi:hypothetical protein
MRQAMTTRPKSRISAPPPDRRRVCDKRPSAATSNGVANLRPSMSPTRADSASFESSSTSAPQMMVMLRRSAAAKKADSRMM